MPYTAITHDSRHPFETYILFAGLVAGVAALFGGLWPASIESAYPMWVQALWGFFLAGGSGCALFGITIKNRSLGIFLEQIGLASFGSACFVYSVVLLWFNPTGGFAISAFLMMVAFASFRQWRRLEKAVKRIIALGQATRRIERGE